MHGLQPNPEVSGNSQLLLQDDTVTDPHTDAKCCDTIRGMH